MAWSGVDKGVVGSRQGRSRRWSSERSGAEIGVGRTRNNCVTLAEVAENAGNGQGINHEGHESHKEKCKDE